MTKRSSDMEHQLTEWVASRVGVKPERVTPSTRINFDLGVDGDDGVELIEEFGKRFGVDVGGFSYTRYFGPEAGFSPIYYIYHIFVGLVRLLRGRSLSGLEPLRVADLVKWAEEKRVSA